MTDTFLAPLANHLWQSTVSALGVWLLTFTLRRNRAGVRYWLWLAASVKFLIPFAVLVSIGEQLHWQPARVITPPQFSVVINQFGRPFQALAPTATDTVVARIPNLLPSILFGVWLCGAALGLIFWLRSLRRMHAIQRAAARLPFDFAIPVMSSPARIQPGVFGIWKPVLLLPEGIKARLTPAQLKTVLAHELCHVRRHDNLTAAIHMLVEIIFWFHPLVWLIRTRLVAERERAPAMKRSSGILMRTSTPRAFSTCAGYPLGLGVVGIQLGRSADHRQDPTHATLQHPNGRLGPHAPASAPPARTGTEC